MIDFMSLLRSKEVRSLAEVKLAQIEVGGELTVVLKGENDFSRIVIENGKVNEKNLKTIGKNKTWLRKELTKYRAKAQEIFFAEWYEGKLYIIKFK